jgi:hypothetical protein
MKKYSCISKLIFSTESYIVHHLVSDSADGLTRKKDELIESVKFEQPLVKRIEFDNVFVITTEDMGKLFKKKVFHRNKK